MFDNDYEYWLEVQREYQDEDSEHFYYDSFTEYENAMQENATELEIKSAIEDIEDF